jgi:hypothetical protein
LRALIALCVIGAGLIAARAYPGEPLSAGRARSGLGGAGQDTKALTASYPALAARSVRLLETSYYNGTGLWHMCVPVGTCSTKNRDWGADALTNVLYFRWALSRDRSVLPFLRTLAQTAPLWQPGASASSDSVAWDAVADVRMYQATGSKTALAKAEAALAFVDSEPGLGSGACPAVDYQWPYRQRSDLKTIETASNYVKAAILLYQVTGARHYLDAARQQYAQVRAYFLARPVPLYSAYMFDNGQSCQVLPGQYFASVNGNMIWAGSALAAATGHPGYLRQAIATARAVQARLSDAAGIFADLQADNDIVEPLIEAMYRLATHNQQRFATRWLLANASAAGADITPQGQFGRFFDGPPPAAQAPAWQINGGIALAIAAAALNPRGQPANPAYWHNARLIPDSQTLTPRGQVRITFTGKAIAILGTIGAHCCTQGHASISIDHTPTYNHVGIWQNYSSPSRQQPGQVLFAWRWPTTGHHTITIGPAPYNPEQGGTYFSMTSYLLVR